MEPMFFGDVESAETQSPFNDLIQTARRASAEYPQIWRLFAFPPHATKHLEHLTPAIMREPAPLSRGLREPVAASISARHHCPFGLKSHAAVSAVLLEDEALVAAVMQDLESSRLGQAEKTLLRSVDKVNRDSIPIGPPDVVALHEAGWTDAAIDYAITRRSRTDGLPRAHPALPATPGVPRQFLIGQTVEEVQALPSYFCYLLRATS